MIPIDYRSTPLVDINRAEIAGLVAQFLDHGGQIQVIPGIEQRLDKPYQWNRNDLVLPGSSCNSAEENRTAALVRRIRELAEKGAGVTAMKMDMHIDPDKIKRIAKEHGIVIPKAYAKTGATEVAKAAKVAAGKLRRSKYEPIIRKLCAERLTIAQISERAGCGIRTVFRVIDEYQIERK